MIRTILKYFSERSPCTVCKNLKGGDNIAARQVESNALNCITCSALWSSAVAFTEGLKPQETGSVHFNIRRSSNGTVLATLYCEDKESSLEFYNEEC